MRRTLLALALVIGCKDSKPSTTADQAMASLASFRDRMCACKAPDCVKQVAEQMAAWSAKQPNEKPAALTAVDQDKATKLSNEIGECMLAASSAGSAGSAGSAAVASGSAAGSTGSAGSASGPTTASSLLPGVPRECDEYRAAVEKLKGCEMIAKAAREQLVNNAATNAKNLAAMPEESRASMAEACKAARDSVLAAGKAQCGW